MTKIFTISHMSQVDQISNLVGGSGTPYDIGESEDHVKAIIETYKSDLTRKPFCVVSDWTWVDFDVSESEKSLFEKEGISPCGLYSNCVVFDELGRSNPSECIRSTQLLDFRDNCIFETRNSLYILQGPGKRMSMDFRAFMSIFL